MHFDSLVRSFGMSVCYNCFISGILILLANDSFDYFSTEVSINWYLCGNCALYCYYFMSAPWGLTGIWVSFSRLVSSQATFSEREVTVLTTHVTSRCHISSHNHRKIHQIYLLRTWTYSLLLVRITLDRKVEIYTGM